MPIGKKTGIRLKTSRTDLNSNARPDPRGNKKKKWVQIVIDLMRENYSRKYIWEHIANNKEGSVSYSAINEIFSEANSQLSASQFLKNEEVTALHVARYNRTIKKLLAVEELDQELIDSEEEGGISYETWMRSRQRKIKAYFDCIDTMVQKETLLQYHTKGFTLEINEKENIEIKEEKPKFDVTKLSFEEQLELYQLISKAKKDENNLISVIEANRDNKTETIDVVAEVIEKPNVEDIKHEELPEKPYVSPVTSFDPTVLLRKRLKEAAAKELKKVGANLTDDEKKLIK